MFNFVLVKINLFFVYNDICIYNLGLVKVIFNLEVIFFMLYFYLSEYLGYLKEIIKVGSIYFVWYKEFIIIWF